MKSIKTSWIYFNFSECYMLDIWYLQSNNSSDAEDKNCNSLQTKMFHPGMVSENNMHRQIKQDI